MKHLNNKQTAEQDWPKSSWWFMCTVCMVYQVTHCGELLQTEVPVALQGMYRIAQQMTAVLLILV